MTSARRWRAATSPWPLPQPVRVLVAGGGPAGLTAATAAALRGAQVRLIDPRPELGGTLSIAARPPFKEPIADLARYLGERARAAGVTVELGRAFSPAVLAEIEPDEVIVATGSLPWAPSCIGMSDGGVVAAESILQCDRI